jgi:hypothetical protein
VALLELPLAVYGSRDARSLAALVAAALEGGYIAETRELVDDVAVASAGTSRPNAPVPPPVPSSPNVDNPLDNSLSQP